MRRIHKLSRDENSQKCPSCDTGYLVITLIEYDIIIYEGQSCTNCEFIIERDGELKYCVNSRDDFEINLCGACEPSLIDNKLYIDENNNGLRTEEIIKGLCALARQNPPPHCCYCRKIENLIPV